MKVWRLIITVFSLILFFSCSGQGKEKTYWKTEDVARTDGSPIWGIPLAFVEMIAEMQIHLSIQEDNMEMDYPFPRKLKTGELKSLTGCRSADGNSYIDSVVAVEQDGKQLQIRFYFSDAKKPFVLNMVRLSKEAYKESLQTLREADAKLKAQLKPLDVAALDLSIAAPAYFYPKSALSTLNPIQMAESLCSIDDGFVGSNIADSFRINNHDHLDPGEKDLSGNYAFRQYKVEHSDKLGFVAARLGDLSFHNLQMTYLGDAAKADAIAFAEDMDTKTMLSLLAQIQKRYPSATLSGDGLPEVLSNGRDILGISPFFSISWQQDGKTLRMMIESPDEMTDKEYDKDFVLPFDGRSSKMILANFRHYLEQVPKTRVAIVIYSDAIDALMQSDGFSGTRPGIYGL